MEGGWGIPLKQLNPKSNNCIKCYATCTWN